MKPLEPATLVRKSDKEIAELAAHLNASFAEIKALMDDHYNNDEIWLNDIYQVAKRDVNEHFVHLSIKRIDKQPIHDWRHLQQIKNQLVGPENEGMELYPAESRVVDTANQYHLWVLKDPAMKINVGWTSGLKVQGSAAGAVQRDFE